MDYAHCAPFVAPETLAAVIHVESRGRPLALNINGGNPLPSQPSTVAEAAALARAAMARGHSVDIGLMQVNSQHLARLGLTVEALLDPCTNIRAGAQVLSQAYERATRLSGRGGGEAMQRALSIYNTGHPQRGFATGYVAKYYGPQTALQAAQAPSRTLNPYTAPSRVYERKEQAND